MILKRSKSFECRQIGGKFLLWKKTGSKGKFIELTGSSATLWSLIDGRRSLKEIKKIIKTHLASDGNNELEGLIEREINKLYSFKLLK